MNSKIFKNTSTKVDTIQITEANVSGMMFHAKFELWLATHALVLMWETNLSHGGFRQGFSESGKEIAIERDTWSIEFQYVRAVDYSNPKFNGATIIAGTIKNSFDMINGKSTPVYLLQLHSRSYSGEQTFTSAKDLWTTLTNIGAK